MHTDEHQKSPSCYRIWAWNILSSPVSHFSSCSLQAWVPLASRSSLSCHTPFSKSKLLLGLRDLGSRKRKECCFGAQHCSTRSVFSSNLILVMWWVNGITPGLIILLLKRILLFKRRVFESLDYSGREVETASGLVFTRTDNLLNWTLGALSHHVRSQMTYLRDQRKDRPCATWKEIEAKEAANGTQSCLACAQDETCKWSHPGTTREAWPCHHLNTMSPQLPPGGS